MSDKVVKMFVPTWFMPNFVVGDVPPQRRDLGVSRSLHSRANCRKLLRELGINPAKRWQCS
jgi:transcriptional regulator of met regulon